VHALKYALRQDPDVILVGEMRDEETVMMALNAAETGHLVLSTLHTNDATESINRILGTLAENAQGAVRIQLASVLVGVVSQRLLRKKDGHGRIAAVETLVNSPRVREFIADPNRTHLLKNVIEESQASGMQSFDQSMMYLIRQNLITEEEALANCDSPRDFKMKLEGVIGGDWREENEKTEIDMLHSPTKAPPPMQSENSDSIEIEFESIKKKA
jgi:twitching motility protein PilT